MTIDAIIIGGGIIGCSLAFFLTRNGQRVALVEPNGIATGTTGNSFAWANASTKTTDAAYHRLNATGVAGYRALAEEFAAPSLGINPAGALQVVGTSDSPGHRTMLADAAALTGFGYANHLLDHAGLAALEPHMVFAPDSKALHLPDDLIIDAPHFTRFLTGEVTRLGGRILATAARNLIADEDGIVRGIETDAGPLQARNVILATGADTPEVLAALTGYDGFASRFPLRKVPGLLMTTPPVQAGLVNHLIYTSTTHELHMLPAPNGGLKIGSDDVDGLIWEDRSDQAKRKAAEHLLARAAAFLPALPDLVDLDACTLQIGIRPYPEDGKTIAGPLPGANGLYLIATHSGITLAPVLGTLMADWLVSGQRPAALAPFGLERFAGFSA